MRILVYQFGKVASSTVVNSLEKLNLDVVHTHEHSLGKLNTQLYPKIWVIMPIRNVYDRMYSAFFQNLDIVMRHYGQNTSHLSDQVLQIDLDIFMHMKKLVPEAQWTQMESMVEWFGKVKVALGIDVFSKPFDRENGYNIYETDKVNLLIYRYEDMDKIALTDIIKDFLGLKGLSLVDKNVTSNKWYSHFYRSFRNKARFNDKDLKTFWEIDYMQHFYTEEERKRFLTSYGL